MDLLFIWFINKNLAKEMRINLKFFVLIHSNRYISIDV